MSVTGRRQPEILGWREVGVDRCELNTLEAGSWWEVTWSSQGILEARARV
jgi:hypothetical protein